MKAVWLLFGLSTAAVMIMEFHDVLLVFFAAAIFAVALRSGAVAFSKALRVPIAGGIAGVIAAGAAVVAGVLWLWEVMIAAQVRQLLVMLPGAAETVLRFAQREPWASQIAANIPDPSVLLTGAGGMVGMLRGFLGGAAAIALDVAILIFVSICFAAEPQTYIGGFLQFVVPAKRERVDATLHEAAGTIAFWLLARAISMGTVGVLVGIGLHFIGIPDVTALAILAAIFAFVPNVGAIAAVIPSLLLAAPLGWQRVLAVLAIYWIAHALDDFIVIPIAERRIVRLPPALTIASQVVLGLAGGVLGIMMAAPFVAVAIVLLHRLVVEDIVDQN